VIFIVTDAVIRNGRRTIEAVLTACYVCSRVRAEAKTFDTFSAKRSTTSCFTDDAITGCHTTKVCAHFNDHTLVVRVEQSAGCVCVCVCVSPGNKFLN